MTIFIIRRILQAAVVTLITLSVVFVVGRVVGDPVRIVIGIEAEEVRVQQVRDQLGLNDPLTVQYWKFLDISGKNVFIGFLTCFLGRKILKTFFPEISKNFQISTDMSLNTKNQQM